MPSNRFARLDQLLSSLGYGSRSDVRKFISQGRVTGKGELKAEGRYDPRDLQFDDEALDNPNGLLLMLHKPVGLVCTHSDKEGPTVFSLLPDRWLARNPKIVSVGRLDKDTSGLILLTDRHQIVHDLTSPKKKVGKIYEVEVDRKLDSNLVDVFSSGTLKLKNEKNACLPAKLQIKDSLKCELLIYEGMYHQVRRMFASQGYEVLKLHRKSFGSYELGDLPEGKYRTLSLEEI